MMWFASVAINCLSRSICTRSHDRRKSSRDQLLSAVCWLDHPRYRRSHKLQVRRRVVGKRRLLKSLGDHCPNGCSFWKIRKTRKSKNSRVYVWRLQRRNREGAIRVLYPLPDFMYAFVSKRKNDYFRKYRVAVRIVTTRVAKSKFTNQKTIIV